MGARGGGNRVEARLEFPERTDDGGGRGGRGTGGLGFGAQEDVDDMEGRRGRGRRGRARRHEGREQGEQRGGRLAQVVELGERAAERDGGAVGRGDGLLAVAAEGDQYFGYERRAVVGDDAEGVAGGVGEAGLREVELDVVDLFGGAGGVEVAGGKQPGGVGAGAVVAALVSGRGVLVLDGSRRGRGRGRGDGTQGGEGGGEPSGESLLVVEVAVGAGCDARGAELLEPRVEVGAAPAELRVVGVAEGADAVAQSREPRGGRRAPDGFGEGGVEGLGVVGRLTVAVGAGDDEEVLLGGEASEVDLREIDDGGGEVASAGLLGGAFGEAFGGAGLRAEDDRERRQRRRGRRTRRGRRWGRGAGEETGEKAVEPGALLGAEGRGFRDERDGGHEGG